MGREFGKRTKESRKGKGGRRLENKIYINHRGTIFNPEPIEEIQWSTRLYGAGELKFKVLKDNVMDFKEGDQVTFYRNNIPIFKGYVFAKERHKNSPLLYFAMTS